MSVPPGAPAAPLHRPPEPPEKQWAATSTEQPTRQTITAQIEAHFPGVHCWWGLRTCRWWAYVPTAQGGRLLEATTPNALFAQVARAMQRPGEGLWKANR
ncbi:hypothetical protein GCM10009546_69230 [Actinomadura livida]|uniref:Uncharacterized protein n=1 Tax=Actinomadura livida TaxID=79909 RepID=A0ABN1FTI9_9ACTN|nr:hypothetical protein GCM10010208_74940 [Actinomadura livida]